MPHEPQAAPNGGDARDGRIDCRSRSVRGNADLCLSLPLRLSWARWFPGNRGGGAVAPVPAAPVQPVQSSRPPASGRLGGKVTDPVTVERDGHVLLIGVNRPAQRNAFDLAVIEALGAAYETLGLDQELRAGVLFGHGDHFSAAGSGPGWPAGGPGRPWRPGRLAPLRSVRGLAGPGPKPVVLAVNGIAYTLSIELALAADIVVAADDVRFRQLEIGRGIVPFGGATFRAPAQLGWGNAMRFLLTAEEFGAAEALRIGLVQEVVPAGSAPPASAGTGPADRPAGASRCPGHAGQRARRTQPRPRRGARAPSLAAAGHLAQPRRG